MLKNYYKPAALKNYYKPAALNIADGTKIN